jgi:hypothetical protein
MRNIFLFTILLLFQFTTNAQSIALGDIMGTGHANTCKALIKQVSNAPIIETSPYCAIYNCDNYSNIVITSTSMALNSTMIDIAAYNDQYTLHIMPCMNNSQQLY